MARFANIGPGASMVRQLPCSVIDLHLRAENLKDADMFSKSDPIVNVFMRRPTERNWQFVGSTEKVMDNLSPTFVKSVRVDYFFEEVQLLRFQVLDVDSEVNGRYTGDDLGYVECSVSDIVTSRPFFRKQLAGVSKKSFLVVTAEQIANVGGSVTLQFAGRKLANKDGWFGKSDPFFLIHKGREDGSWVTVAKSEVIMNNLNPSWKPYRIPFSLLCNGDFNRPLRIEVFDFDRDDSVDKIGHGDTTLAAMMRPGWELKLLHPKGKNKDVGTVVGTAIFVQEPTLVDYLQGGLEIGLTVAIDFTASNGDPRDPRSLHYNSPDPNHQNPYETAVRATADVLLPYDRDGLVPTYGYGAALPPSGVVSHCFALNGQPQSPAVCGVDGILGAYNQALRSVSLSGPTCFAPVISAMAASAAMSQSGQELRYSVLLIVTDGEIMDMDATVDAIVRASGLPLSIIIVGVGAGPFGKMEELDGDTIALRNRSGVAKRDIVQFVKMSDYAGLGSGARLAKDVLHELPGQVVQFFLSVGRRPPPPLQQAPPQQPQPPPPQQQQQQQQGVNVNVQLPAMPGAPAPPVQQRPPQGMPPPSAPPQQLVQPQVPPQGMPRPSAPPLQQVQPQLPPQQQQAYYFAAAAGVPQQQQPQQFVYLQQQQPGAPPPGYPAQYYYTQAPGQGRP